MTLSTSLVTFLTKDIPSTKFPHLILHFHSKGVFSRSHTFRLLRWNKQCLKVFRYLSDGKHCTVEKNTAWWRRCYWFNRLTRTPYFNIEFYVHLESRPSLRLLSEYSSTMKVRWWNKQSPYACKETTKKQVPEQGSPTIHKTDSINSKITTN